MAVELPQRSAEILTFPPSRPVRNLFTFRDRLEVMQWQAADCTGARLAIHKRRDNDPPEVGEFASIYLAGQSWAVWCAARQGLQINVWRTCDGRDLGWWGTMREVLAMVTGWTVSPLPDPGAEPCRLKAATGRAD
jgi:hypothetical protein